MTVGVSHDLDSGAVMLVDKAARTIYEFSPERARAVAADLRAAAAAGGAVLIVAEADDGRQVRLGGEAVHALRMAHDLERNADLGEILSG